MMTLLAPFQVLWSVQADGADGGGEPVGRSEDDRGAGATGPMVVLGEGTWKKCCSSLNKAKLP